MSAKNVRITVHLEIWALWMVNGLENLKMKTFQMIFSKIKGYKGEVLLQDVVDVLRALDENIDRNIEVPHQSPCVMCVKTEEVQMLPHELSLYH